MEKLKIVYFGTPDFSARFLEKLLLDSSINRLIEVKLAVTQPDRPVGRKQIITPTPVKMTANRLQIKCLDANENCKLKIENLLNQCDLAVLYAFGKIIPSSWLKMPRLGFWCIHPSLLPLYRGPSPMAYPLMLGDRQTGVTIYKMDEKIDHGPIIAQEKYKISSADRRPDLELKLTNIGFELLQKVIIKLTSSRVNELQIIPQDHNKASYTRMLEKNDGFISLTALKKALNDDKPAILNLFRGLYPWPGIWTMLPNNKRLKLTELSMINGKMVIDKVQLEGKKEVDYQTFNRAYHLI